MIFNALLFLTVLSASFAVPAFVAGVIVSVASVFGVYVDFGGAITIAMIVYAFILLHLETKIPKLLSVLVGLAFLSGFVAWIAWQLTGIYIAPHSGPFVVFWLLSIYGLFVGVSHIVQENEQTRHEFSENR